MIAAVHALRRHWPQTRIVWVIGRVEYGLVAGMEGVEFVVYDKKSGCRW